MKRIVALMLAVLMLFSFAACSKKEENSTAPAENGDSSLAGTIVTVGYTIYEPMNYEDENGKLIGFDTELAQAVFKELGCTVIFKKIDWSQKYSELDAGTISCIWNGFTSNSEDDGVPRNEIVDFSYNYMKNKQVIVTSKAFAETVTDAAAFKEKVGAVEEGSAGDAYLTDNLEGAIKKPVLSQLDALKEVQAKTADFTVLDEQLAKAYVGKGAYADLAIVKTVSGEAEFYAIGFKKGSELTAKVNEALEKLAKDGTIAELAKKYGVSNTAITDFSDQK